MEVHAHSHTTRKKWTHYFWEFLMLFLAVFCGFLAEYKLEHTIEHQREIKFAKLLYEDFKKDTTLIENVMSVKTWRTRKLDSLFYFLSLPDLQSNASAIYYYSHFVMLNYQFAPNDATIQQLSSSGSLRYFSNLELYNTITTYYSNCGWNKKAEEANKINISQTTAKMFQGEQFYSLVSNTTDIRGLIRYPGRNVPFQLLTTDKSILNEFLVQAKQSNFNDYGIMNILIVLRTQLGKLIDEIKKEYHLE